MFCSSKRRVLPSAEMPLGNDQLSQVRFRSTLSAAENPTISRREDFMPTRMRQSRAASRRQPAGMFQTDRVFPESEVAEMLSRPVDQTSSPRGDHASPEMANGPVIRTFPSVSTTLTVPLLSPRNA